jgi:hypothetical protein
MIPSNTRLPAGVEYTDFVAGYSIIDGKTEGHVEQFTFDVEGDIVAVSDTMTESFDDKFSAATELALKNLSAIMSQKVTLMRHHKDGTTSALSKPIACLFMDAIDNHVWAQKIHWMHDDGLDGRACNEDMFDSIREEVFAHVIKQLNLSTRLTTARENLREHWGEFTDARFDIMVNKFHFNKHVELGAQVQDYVGRFLKSLSKKQGGRPVTQAENKLVWNVFFALSEFDKRFPLVNVTWDRQDKELYKKGICGNLGKHIFWSLAAKRRHETPMESKEPADLVTDGAANGPVYTSDFSDVLAAVERSSGEHEFNESYLTYNYEDKDGVMQQRIYRRPTDYFEYAQSLKVGIQIGNWIVHQFESGENFHTYRWSAPIVTKSDIYKRVGGKRVLHKKAGETIGYKAFNGLGILQYIQFLAGRRYKTILMEPQFEKNIDGNLVPVEYHESITDASGLIRVKKSTKKFLLDYHEKLLMKMFWDFYRLQQSSGVIAPKVAVAPPDEYEMV